MRSNPVWLIVAASLAACGGGKDSVAVVDPGSGTPTEDELQPPDPINEEPVVKVTKPPYPETRREDVVETLHGVRIADPYRWLEDVSQQEVKDWMTAQDDFTRQHLAALPQRDAIAARLKEVFYYDAVTAPTHRKGRYFFTRRHADKEKSIVYWKQGQKGAEKVLFDPNTWSEDGSISLGGWWPSWDGKKVAYTVKQNAADEATMYVIDVASGKRTKDEILGAKYAGASWTPDGKGFYYTWLPIDPAIAVADRPGFAEYRYHALGTEAAKDPVIREATKNAETFLGGDLSEDGHWLFVEVQHGWNSTDVWVKDLRGGARAAAKRDFAPLAVGRAALYSVTAWKDQLYVVTNEDAPRYRVFKVDPAKLAREDWKEIVPESEATLEGLKIIGGHLVLSYLRNASSELAVHDLDGALVRTVALPGIGTTGGMTGNPDEDDAYFGFSSFTEPSVIYHTSIKTGAVDEWARVTIPVDTSKMVVEQVWYPSKDGTKISMFVIHNAGAPKDGSNPTILYGYGGFNVNMTPAFQSSLAVWLELGGVYAIPNLRGGGEYGEAWHKAGMMHNKQNVFDDYIAAAKYLVKEGWTSAAKLAIRGGSNGGLLVSAAMTQAPELFKAVICAVPLIDMVRYHLYGSGKTWIPEYGSAEDPAEFQTIIGYSPQQKVKEGVAYPSMLMLSADSDDRVDPMHARKFVAAVQHATSSAAPALLRIERNAGHGGADLVKQQVESTADTYAFVLAQLAAP
jgi:prolyl oligopeptidase